MDNLIENEKGFYEALTKALETASSGHICTLGMKALEPTPNFGYIQAQGRGNKGVFSVKKFIEKPAPDIAAELIRQGNCFYNSGMFVTGVHTLIEEFKNHYSDYSFFTQNFNQKKISSLYEKIPDIPFDKAIMEKTKKVKMIKGNFFWRDFGNWQTMLEILAKDKNGNAAKGNSFVHEGKNNFIYLDNPKKKILVMGVEDLFFIDTQGYTLLADKRHLNNLKAALKKFKL